MSPASDSVRSRPHLVAPATREARPPRALAFMLSVLMSPATRKWTLLALVCIALFLVFFAPVTALSGLAVMFLLVYAGVAFYLLLRRLLFRSTRVARRVVEGSGPPKS
jgi:hypothetical protein